MRTSKKSKILRGIRECKKLLSIAEDGIENDKSSFSVCVPFLELVSLLTKVEAEVYNYYKEKENGLFFGEEGS